MGNHHLGVRSESRESNGDSRFSCEIVPCEFATVERGSSDREPISTRDTDWNCVCYPITFHRLQDTRSKRMLRDRRERVNRLRNDITAKFVSSYRLKRFGRATLTDSLSDGNFVCPTIRERPQGDVKRGWNRRIKRITNTPARPTPLNNFDGAAGFRIPDVRRVVASDRRFFRVGSKTTGTEYTGDAQPKYLPSRSHAGCGDPIRHEPVYRGFDGFSPGATEPSIMSEEYRIERDSIGEVRVPATAKWGAQTQRAIENFPISGVQMGPRFVRALGVVKKAAAAANRDLGLIEEEIADAIIAAADEVIAGEHDHHFPVDVFQTGSGTSSNMNANEVIATLASDRIDADVHPNDHVNFGQSSNDVIPTAMHVAALTAIEEDVLPGLHALEESLAAKTEAFADVVKTGRTHLQDATPVTLGQEFGGYRAQIEKGIERVERSRDELAELALGGTAVGTGLNTHEEFADQAATYIAEETGLDVREADNHFEAQAAHDAIGHAHGALRTVAGSMNKMANDLRLLASGPRNGLGEIEQPENQPGSSIMPGKVNPVVAEAINQVHKQVIGNDAAIAAASADGQLELNLYKPLLAHNYLQSATLIGNGSRVFAARFIDPLEANAEHCADQVAWSMALATALNPHIGYDAAAETAKKALESGRTIREVAIENGHVDEDEADAILDPMQMTTPGILGQR